MEDKIFRSSAHPTMGIVLLGGLKDNVSRHPYHDSFWICWTLWLVEMYVVRWLPGVREYCADNGET